MLGTACTTPPAARAGTDGAALPQVKRTKAGLYPQAQEVPAFIAAQGGPARVLFPDVRTRAVALYVGMASAVDALVPLVEHQELMTDSDDRRGIHRLEALQDLVPEVERRRTAKGLAKTGGAVLMGRSGDRRTRAADRWAADG